MRIIKKKVAYILRPQRTLIVTFMLVATLLATGSLSPNQALAASPVEAMVRNFGNQVLYILASNQTVSQQKKLFRKAFLHNADIAAIANFTLGKYARKIKPSDRNQLNLLLSDYIVQLFVVKLRGTQSEGLEVLRTTERKKGRDYLVKSVIRLRKIPGQSDAPLPVKWRIKKNKNGELKLNDINIGGFWLAQEQRSTFVDIISRNNGKISALLEYLKLKTDG
jgi:phospholipid transport system substrate-binding protein